jgi:elongation factor G
MSAITYVMSVPLVPADAMAALKLRAAIDEMCATDDTLGVAIGPVNEIILQAVSELQLDTVVDRLKREFKVEANVGQPQVLYREIITRKIRWEYTHKVAGSGEYEYAKVAIRLEPGARDSGFRFTNEAGDSVPAAFVPAVERGLARACENGPTAGFPVVDLACALIDGDCHEVDSNEQTFETAACSCLRQALPRAGPWMLEPIMLVRVLTPQEYLGVVIGDLHSRRGLVIGMDQRDDKQEISVRVPLANLFGHISTLRSMTRGSAQCTMTFGHYEQLWPNRPDDGGDTFPPAVGMRA